MNYKQDLSIVIPTLGETTLNNTLEAILNGSVIPKEIIVVLPIGHNFKLKINTKNSDIIKIVFSQQKGQVSQRIFGFKKSNSKYVLQLDSDILLNTETIKNLIKYADDHFSKIAVAPMLYPIKINKKNNKESLMIKLRNLIISKRTYLKPGIITDIGYNSWFDEKGISKDTYIVDWLPGGCILHKKENLILQNYYPFNGKAYCEDVIHSLYLKQKNVKLHLLTNEKIKNIGYSFIKNNFFNKLQEFKVRYYILKKIKGNILRFLLWYLIYVIR